MENPIVTIITPTLGRKSLDSLIDSIKIQDVSVKHLILWDINRDISSNKDPSTYEAFDKNYTANCIVINDDMVNGAAKSSALIAIGLMITTTDYVTFADDDVIWEGNHLKSLLDSIKDKKWAFSKRKIWTKVAPEQFEFLGIDEFESLGDEAKTVYKSVDNNTLIFERRFGTSAACIYRETKEQNKDILIHEFLSKYAGEAGRTRMATINRVCSTRLAPYFRNNCVR